MTADLYLLEIPSLVSYCAECVLDDLFSLLLHGQLFIDYVKLKSLKCYQISWVLFSETTNVWSGGVDTGGSGTACSWAYTIRDQATRDIRALLPSDWQTHRENATASVHKLPRLTPILFPLASFPHHPVPLNKYPQMDRLFKLQTTLPLCTEIDSNQLITFNLNALTIYHQL